MSGIWLPNWSELAVNSKNCSDVTVFWHDVIVKFFDVVLFLLSGLVTDLSFVSISSLVSELWQFLFIRDWPEIRKSEIPLPELWAISRDWGEYVVPNLARKSPIKCYWMLQNARFTAFTVFELLRKNQQGGNSPSSPTQIRVNDPSWYWRCNRGNNIMNQFNILL